MEVAKLLEAAMIIAFGISWPMSILKSWRSRTAEGKSGFFLIMILLGYLAGILAKITASDLSYVVVFYAVNLIMVGVDLCLWLRNKGLDARREV